MLKPLHKAIGLRVARGALLALAVVLMFIFFHRSVLGKGGLGGPSLVHEDTYGPILFVLYMAGFCLVPLPRPCRLVLVLIRSLILTGAISLSTCIVGLGFPDPHFRLENFMAIVSLSVFASLFLWSGHIELANKVQDAKCCDGKETSDSIQDAESNEL